MSISRPAGSWTSMRPAKGLPLAKGLTRVHTSGPSGLPSRHSDDFFLRKDSAVWRGQVEELKGAASRLSFDSGLFLYLKGKCMGRLFADRNRLTLFWRVTKKPAYDGLRACRNGFQNPAQFFY